jgi:light-regulated signal transduction histidine kinase (bacteriophytochrome)
MRSMLSLVHDITAERHALDEIRDLNRRLEARVHRRTRALVEANADLKSFTYSVSHDLRAPVRAVVGLGEILDRRYRSHLPEQGARYLSLILEAGA